MNQLNLCEQIYYIMIHLKFKMLPANDNRLILIKNSGLNSFRHLLAWTKDERLERI